MSSSRANTVTNSLGIVMPRAMADIVDDHHNNPHHGRLLDRVHTYWREEIAKEAAILSTETTDVDMPDNNTAPSPKTFTYKSCTPLGIPIFEGSINIDENDNGQFVTVNCQGYLVYIPKEDPYAAVIVLELPLLGMKTCLSEVHMFDKETLSAFFQSEVGKQANDKRITMFCRSMDIAPITTKKAIRGDVRGHLLVDAPKNFKGRVVDDQLHYSLTKAGCLRIGKHSLNAFYTLPRPFCINEQHLKDYAFMLISTDGTPNICGIGKDWRRLIKFGLLAIEGRLNVHTTLKDALIALDTASKLPTPKIDDIILQVSIGGDPKSTLNVGKFLPCEKLSNKPDITVRCACGFEVDGIQKSKGILKRRCNRKKNDKEMVCTCSYYISLPSSASLKSPLTLLSSSSNCPATASTASSGTTALSLEVVDDRVGGIGNKSLGTLTAG